MVSINKIGIPFGNMLSRMPRYFIKKLRETKDG